MSGARLLIALAGVAALAAVIRFSGINRECLWYDEIWHVTLSSGHGSSFRDIPLNTLVDSQTDVVHLDHARPALEIPRRMDQVLHPPLYHLVLRAWREIAGDRPEMIRPLSAALSVIVVVLTGVVARRACGDGRAALLAAVITALSATQLMQAQDGRGYTLLAAVGLATLLAMLGLVSRGRSMVLSIAVAIGCLAMMFTHYFAAGACAGIGLITATKLRGRARWETLGALAVAGAAWAMLWLPTLRDQLAHVAETADVFLDDSATPGAALRTLGRLALLPTNLLADMPEGVTPLRGIIGILLWLAMLAAAVVRPSARLPLLFAVGAVAPVLLLDLVRSTQHLYYTRYTLLAAPAMWIGVAMLATPPPNRARPTPWGLVPLVIALLAGLTLPIGYEQNRADFRPMSAAIAGAASPETVLVICSGNPRGRDAQSAYLYTACYTRVFPRSLVIANRPIAGDLLSQLVGRDLLLAAPGERMFSVLGDGVELLETRSVEPFGAVARARVRAPSTNRSDPAGE